MFDSIQTRRCRLNLSSRCAILLSAGFFVASLFTLHTGMLRAQSAPAAGQAPAPLRVATQLVEVHVIVKDKNGAPVAGLTQEDFTLLDQGQPQRIAFFSEESGNLIQAPAGAQPLPPGTFSNRYEQTGQMPGSVTVILLDGLNTASSSGAYARESVIKLLRRLNPGDHVALYVLGTELTVIQDFTQDSAALLRALDRYEGQFSTALAASTPEPSDTGDALVDAMRDAADKRAADYYIGKRARFTSQAILAIANHLASVPGRKNLVWLSSDYPISVDWIARALNQADMAIYPVDPCGLAPPPMLSANHACPAVPEFEVMNGLADRTGGRASYNNNDIADSVRTAIDDGRSSYVLAYYPTNGKWDGQFREISVKVDRPDVQVRSRKGYFALQEVPSGQKEMHAVIEDALSSPLDSTGLGLTIGVEPGPQKGQAIFWMTLDARGIRLDEDAGHWKGDLKMVFCQYNAAGNRISSAETHMALNLDKANYDLVTERGVKLVRHMSIAPQAETVKVLMLDTESGTMGTVTVPVKNYAPPVPEGTAAPPGAPSETKHP